MILLKILIKMKQLNINKNFGEIYLEKTTRFSSRFKRLNEEIEKDQKIDEVIDKLQTYNKSADLRSMPEKLEDGGFSKEEIYQAKLRKQQYWMSFEKHKFYKTAQIIDSEIFALLKFNFDTYIYPLILQNEPKNKILLELNSKVILPILTLLNKEGEEDTYLNYSVDDLLGMLYFITGKCHINWK